ncbi:MAG TPA: cytochrome c maturation protein CcmE [Alphaproteobacteria bacterium]|jgi:cytochrome c-type biogenesis protein CcmE
MAADIPTARAPSGRSLSPAKARRRKRLALVVGGLLALGGATALVLTAFQDSLVFFYSPSELMAKAPSPERRVRIGGLVEAGSLQKNGQDIRFRITDTTRSIDVTYRGLLPDLFREGQGVVAQGSLMADGSFRANEVLAKHDETYMPPEVADALKKSGRWKEGEGTVPVTPGPETLPSQQGSAP